MEVRGAAVNRPVLRDVRAPRHAYPAIITCKTHACTPAVITCTKCTNCKASLVLKEPCSFEALQPGTNGICKQLPPLLDGSMPARSRRHTLQLIRRHMLEEHNVDELQVRLSVVVIATHPDRVTQPRAAAMMACAARQR
jgi:hypothetical protein